MQGRLKFNLDTKKFHIYTVPLIDSICYKMRLQWTNRSDYLERRVCANWLVGILIKTSDTAGKINLISFLMILNAAGTRVKAYIFFSSSHQARMKYLSAYLSSVFMACSFTDLYWPRKHFAPLQQSVGGFCPVLETRPAPQSIFPKQPTPGTCALSPMFDNYLQG